MIKDLTIKNIQASLEKKEFTCVELIDSCLTKIKNDNLNDFISIFDAEAIVEAKMIDDKINSGEKLKNLEGIPIAIKDNILIKDFKATAGSKMLENYVATYDAEVIKKLKEKGAIFIGKTNLDEFAMGASNETSYFGKVLNPDDKTRVPGGSSGGSASAVKAQHCSVALGSDTGGSIRQPASFCGVVGFKPSYGRVSRNGLVSLSSSLDQIGPLTNSVEDAVIIFNSILGGDSEDMTSLENEKINLEKISLDIKDKVIAFPKNYYQLVIDEDIKNSFDKLLEKLKNMGANLKEIDLSFMDEALSVYYILQPAEASSNLARYDGFRYGLNIKESKDLLENYLNNRSQGFGEEVKRRIIMGNYVLSAGYKDAYYNRAKAVQEDIKNKFNDIFQEAEFLILPTTPSKAFKLNEKTQDPLAMYLSDIFTVSANIAGLPAISVPFISSDNLAIGMQVIGNFMEDEKVFNLAWHIENLAKNK